MRWCNHRLIGILLFIALSAALFLPVYNISFINKSFEEELLKNKEDEAERLSAYLMSMMPQGLKELSRQTIPKYLPPLAEELIRGFRLWKFKVFSPSGEILFSTDPNEIGEFNKHRHFQEIVAQGNRHSLIVSRDHSTMEGQKPALDIVEIYIPIMREGRFTGAFEMYYDITAKKNRIDTLAKRHTYILLTESFLSMLLIGLLYKSYRELITLRDRLTLEAVQRQQVEDNLNRAQEVAQIGSWYLDLVKNELTWSKETYRMFGVKEGTPITVEDFYKIAHPEDCDYIKSQWESALKGNAYDIEHRIIVNGETKWVNEKAEVLFDETGKPISGIGTVQDITKRKEAEDKIKRAYEELSDKNKELQRFHELTIDRELRMIRLKIEVNELREQLGMPKKYEIDEEIK